MNIKEIIAKLEMLAEVPFNEAMDWEIDEFVTAKNESEKVNCSVNLKACREIEKGIEMLTYEEKEALLILGEDVSRAYYMQGVMTNNSKLILRSQFVMSILKLLVQKNKEGKELFDKLYNMPLKEFEELKIHYQKTNREVEKAVNLKELPANKAD
jgi:hypothetical protein